VTVEVMTLARTVAVTLRDRSPGPSGHVTLRGDRATALIEDICHEKIRGCSYRGSGASYSMSAMPA
jgi:hypothetical protein